MFFAACFLFPRELRFLDRVLGGRFSVCSCIVTSFSPEGSSGGASGHGVRFAGTVTSSGGSMIHLQFRYELVMLYSSGSNQFLIYKTEAHAQQGWC